MTVKLVATDLDGTIVRNDLSISERTVAAFRSARDQGVAVVFVTGRPPRWLEPVVQQTGHDGVAICANGALVVDAATGRVLQARTVAAQDFLTVHGMLREALPGAAVALETSAGFRREPEYRTRYDALQAERVAAAEQLVADDPGVLKVLCRVEGVLGDELARRAHDAVGHLVHVTHSNSRDCLIEISAHGVSKAATLAELAARWSIEAADVVAFGDMPNDIEMLRWAGQGYAMTGGHPAALAAADHHAPRCEDDGVAQVVESLLSGSTPAT